MTIVLEAKMISKVYGRRRVLGPVSLCFESGTYYAILGPNGAGKTTCLHLLTGLLSLTSGAVVICERNLDDVLSRRDIGFAPDDVPLPGALTGWEFLRLHNRLRRRGEDDRSAQLARLFEIESALDRQIEEYSHGMRRKLEFVAAVVHEPPVLILDEPFRGLDPRSKLVLRTYLRRYVDAGNTVVVATHDMAQAEKDADRLVLIRNGEVIADGTTSELCALAGNSTDLESAFDALTVSAVTHETTSILLDHLIPQKEKPL